MTIGVRVTLALSQPPLPEGAAPGKCAVALLRGLAAHGVMVTAVAARRPFPYAAAHPVPADLPVTLVDHRETLNRPAIWAQKLRRPRGELSRGPFQDALRSAVGDADVVHLEETETGWCGQALKRPRVLHVHYLVRQDRQLGPPWAPSFRQGAEFALGEWRLARAHRWLVASSPVVAAGLRAMNRRATVIEAPLSLDPRYYPPAPLDGPPTVGLLGTAAWAPTAAAMRRLVRDVWPLLRREAPDARLLVAGRGTAELAGLAGQPGVEVLGAIPSAAAFLQGLSVLLYPLSRGSGMKVKVLEALATGLPVVTTPCGAEGVGPSDGVTVETENRALAAAALEVLRDPLARKERGAAARREFGRRFAPVPATAPLAELYPVVAGG